MTKAMHPHQKRRLAPPPKFNGQRARAWRHTMMAAINAGLEQKLFGLEPGQNYWSNDIDDRMGRTIGGHIYDFSIAGVPGLAYVADAGFDELLVHSVLWPEEKARDLIICGGLHRISDVGAAVAEGWLERRDGCYLQPSTSLFYCQDVFRPMAAALDVVPNGYADHGRFRL